MIRLAWGLIALACPPQEGRGQPAVPVLFSDLTGGPRREITRVSVPFPRGRVRSARRLWAGGRVVPGVELVRWPDGSVAVAQAHVPVEVVSGSAGQPVRSPERLRIPAAGVLETTLRPAPADAEVAVEGGWLVDPARLPLRVEVEDPWGRVFVGRLVDPVRLPLSSELVAVHRLRAVHRRGGAAFLETIAYLVTFRGERRAELTLVLDNGASPHGTAPVLGAVRLRRYSLVTEDRSLRVRPRFLHENLLRPPEPRAGGGWVQHLLGPSDRIYLGDRTGKAFRFDLFVDGERVAESERRAAIAAAAAPLWGLAAVDAVRRSRAFGACGGPAPGGPERSAAALRGWRAAARFGPFGGHGDPEDARAQGTPRNGESALHDVVRWASLPLLWAAETRVLQQTLRPTPGWRPRRPADTEAWREGLSARALRRPHGFTPLDYEHFSVDLLYDWYWLTGDPLARDELARAGSGLRRILEGLPFLTARGEGWCLQGGVLVARATGNRDLVEWLRRRFVERVLPRLGRAPAPAALAQPPHPDAFGPGEDFDAPWQMAALVRGLYALWVETGDARLAEALVRVAEIMAGPGWVEGRGPKYLVSARNPDRYVMPIGYGPLEGSALMEVGAFVLAAHVTRRDDLRALFRRRAAAIARPWIRSHGPGPAGSNRWLQLWLDRETALR